MHFRRLSLMFVASAIGVIAASSSSISLDLNSTTIEDEREATEDPTTLDDAYGKDFNQTIQSEADANDVCTTKVCTQAGVPLRKDQRFRLRLESVCNGSILNTDLYLKGGESCNGFVNPHWHTDKKQNQPRVYWYLNQATTVTSDILTNTPTIMVSNIDKYCASAPDRTGAPPSLADIINMTIDLIKGENNLDYFFYSMSTSHGAHGVDMHRLRKANKPKLISFEYVMKRNGKYLYNVISSEFGRRKFLFRCSGDDTQWTNQFADDTYMEFRTD